MGEFNAVILSVLLVVAIFAAIMIPMSDMYSGLVTSIDSEITEVTNQAKGIGDTSSGEGNSPEETQQ